jgi:hypothetical protein
VIHTHPSQYETTLHHFITSRLPSFTDSSQN